MAQWFFTAITRTSTKVLIIVEEDELRECKDLENQDCSCLIADSVQSQKIVLDDICRIPTDRPYHFIVGKKPDESSSKRSDDPEKLKLIPQIKGVSLYVTEKTSFMHIEDIYIESDLELFIQFGKKRIMIAPEKLSNVLQHQLHSYANTLITFFQ